ncbi:FG-GAP repeat domain-containing protein [Sorangium sp. So ce131]|uniref:FG-GAP repeat domain-containing protein n=1 Tax=Sorangium sp. So ce131 TaxID=3133282 RepID=UPI003F5FF148
MHVNLADGAACSDGDACTQSDTCQAGACVSGPGCPAGQSCVGGACTVSQCLGTVGLSGPPASPVGGTPAAVAAADLNGDGEDDPGCLLIAEGDGTAQGAGEHRTGILAGLFRGGEPSRSVAFPGIWGRA